ncbi:hypothetical protein [Acuticoccus kandeliae]|uniref:hypothetical protein n=1 Tax=Acuticoccus kandeliae TaxID=2073160 RepID=UPI000D3EC10F|nr:hypothetical protein [Acuticoccus kandeliae]
MAIPEPRQTYTIETLSTFAGATTATFVVANAVQSLLHVNPAWVALVVAELICIGTALARREKEGGSLPTMVLVAMLNGVLVFSSAAGVTQVGSSLQRAAEPPGAGAEAPAIDRTFLTPWP